MKPRRRKCRECGEWYMPFNSMQKTCKTPACAIAHGKKLQRKERRRETREARKRLKTRGDVLKEAQQAFNAYIRERDRDKPCISCGAINVEHTRGGGWDCGHYRSTGGNPELRFEERNAAKQCKQCNQHLSGNVVNFRIGLRERIGDDALEWLEGPHEPKRYSKEDLEQIKAEYRRRTRELEKERRAA